MALEIEGSSLQGRFVSVALGGGMLLQGFRI